MSRRKGTTMKNKNKRKKMAEHLVHFPCKKLNMEAKILEAIFLTKLIVCGIRELKECTILIQIIVSGHSSRVRQKAHRE